MRQGELPDGSLATEMMVSLSWASKSKQLHMLSSLLLAPASFIDLRFPSHARARGVCNSPHASAKKLAATAQLVL